MKQVVAVVLAGALLSACEGRESYKVESLQRKDKHLSCAEVMLEINEAEFYRRTAEKNKNPGVGTLLMPLGYISTYMDAEDAASAANARVDYLNRIYDILKCDGKEPPEGALRQSRAAPHSPAAQAVPAASQGYVMVPVGSAPSMPPQEDSYW